MELRHSASFKPTILPTLVFLKLAIILCHAFANVGACLDREREALNTFRKALHDPSHLLSSWDIGDDCCKWRGVSCSNDTGYVTKLDLHADFDSRLSGRIDPALLELKYLQFLDLSYTYFRGSSIPSFLGSMKELKHLNLTRGGFTGRIEPALLQLKHLQVLDLSYNDFSGSSVPSFLGSLKELRHLNLARAGFRGRIPHQLGNLSNLISLQLSSNNLMRADNLGWLRNMTSLEYLDMSNVDLSLASTHWVHVIMNGCPSLIELRLAECYLSYGSPSLSFGNFTSLRVLDISGNGFDSIIPNWIANVSSLISLDLSSNLFGFNGGSIPYGLVQLKKLAHLGINQCRLSGPIPSYLGGLSSLKKLDLSYNQWNGTIPETLGGLSSLEELNLVGNQLSGSIPEALGGLSSLEVLNLEGNQLSGSIPETLGGLSSLKELYVHGNQLNGNIPTALGQLSNLNSLDMSGNFLTGNVSVAHFENLRELRVLALDGNPLVMDLQPHWMPPFQLVQLSLESVYVGPRFPLWLRSQKMIEFLDISNASISDVIPPWLWNITDTIRFLRLSHNMLSGQLPNTLVMTNNRFLDLSWNFINGSIPCISSPSLATLDLSNNQFSGPIPTNFTIPSNFFSASSNRISGTIPTSICKMSSMELLDLSNNSLSGTIPETIGNCTSLSVLDMGSNRLSGSTPSSMGSLMNLDILHLDSNGLSGELPSFLENCSNLVTLDLGDNKFYGKIPSWIGKSFTSLRILRLRGNLFTGGIPPQLFHISSLQVFDVACNRLHGPIPTTFEDLRAMKDETHDNLTHNLFEYWFGSRWVRLYYSQNLIISTKGQTLTYTKTIPLLTCIDLSSNNFSGEIPGALTTLSGLRVLNLSGNHLIGNIPDNIGSLAMLESLDLSRNQLSGIIPQGISNLYFLSYLNLSHNDLSGRIPYGKQLQTLTNPTIYVGNDGLCGFPLSDCGGKGGDGKNHSDEGDYQDEKDHVMFWFYVGIGPGFVVGFWTICGILILKESWRIAYFRLVDGMADKFYIFVMLWMTRLKQTTADGNKMSGQ